MCIATGGVTPICYIAVWWDTCCLTGLTSAHLTCFVVVVVVYCWSCLFLQRHQREKAVLVQWLVSETDPCIHCEFLRPCFHTKCTSPYIWSVCYPQLFSVWHICRSYGQNQSNGGRNSPLVRNLAQSGHVLSDSITGLDTHLEFGPPGEPTYGGSIMSESTVQSRSTFQTQSSHNNLLQAKYSGVQHHWLNQGFSQDTPEDQRRRDFIRGLTDIGDTDSMGAESVASTYV